VYVSVHFQKRYLYSVSTVPGQRYSHISSLSWGQWYLSFCVSSPDFCLTRITLLVPVTPFSRLFQHSLKYIAFYRDAETHFCFFSYGILLAWNVLEPMQGSLHNVSFELTAECGLQDTVNSLVLSHITENVVRVWH